MKFGVKKGQVWLAADGGSYGKVVMGPDDPESDVCMCRNFSKGRGFEEQETDFSNFKMTYRYYKTAFLEWPSWVHVIMESNEEIYEFVKKEGV